MSGFIKRKAVDTANPAGGLNPASSPNVGQYGWTSYDASNVNQIIQYVDLCKKYAEVAAGGAEYVESKYVELEKFMKYIEQVYEVINPIYLGIEKIYTDITKRHEDIKIRHEDIISRHDEIQTWHYEVNVMTEETEANAAKALTSQLLAGQSEQGAETWYNKSYELYDDLRKGNIYRGTWNPHTGAYPNNGGTNSTWDVILNEGETEYRWNNILWFWGDRLVYLKEEDKYQQIESGTTVTSVNGKKGSVVLTAGDVEAVPLIRTVNGKPLSSNISLSSSDTNSVPITRRINNKVLSDDIVLTHEDVLAVPLDRKINNKLLDSDVTLTASDINAVPTTRKINNKPLTSDITLTAEDVSAVTFAVLSAMFPVGHLLPTLNTDNPSTYGYPGTWALIENDTSIITSSDLSQIGVISGNNEPIVPLPAHDHAGWTDLQGSHNHNRGDMEIHGTIDSLWEPWHAPTSVNSYMSGAFGVGGRTGYNYRVGGSATENPQTVGRNIDFYASRHWTGHTSWDTGHTHNVQTDVRGSQGVSLDVRGKNIKICLWRRVS